MRIHQWMSIDGARRGAAPAPARRDVGAARRGACVMRRELLHVRTPGRGRARAGEPPREDRADRRTLTASATAGRGSGVRAASRRRRGSRGGRNRNRARPDAASTGRRRRDGRRPTRAPRPADRRPPVGRSGRAGAGAQAADRRHAARARRRRRAASDDGRPSATAAARSGAPSRRRGGRGRWRRWWPRQAAPVRPVLADDVPLELDDDVARDAGAAASARAGRSAATSCASTCSPPIGRTRQRARHADRGARRPGADRALRLAPGGRRQPDPRQHLPRPGAERPARHGGRVRRHRHAEERGALPRRRAVRPRGRRGANGAASHRAAAAGEADDRLPGHEEPDRRQGRAAHPGGVAARPLRRAHPEQRRPTASRSGCPTTSASGCGRSSTRSSRRSTA